MSRSSKRDIRSECKRVIHELMLGNSIEQITVTQICQAAEISRVTFYIYYDDKYMLLDDYFNDLWDSVIQDYKKQMEGLQLEPVDCFRSFFSSIVRMYYSHEEIFKHAIADADRNLNVRYYQNIRQYTETLLEDFSDILRPRFPIHETAAFLCTGVLGFFHEISQKNMNQAELIDYFTVMIRILVNSDLFIH